MPPFSKKYYRSLDPLLMPGPLSRPADWEAVFGRRAPVELEIGFGNGEYLHRISLERPERDYLGVEVAWASVKRALRRLAAPPRPNVRVMQAPAQIFLGYFCAPESLAAVRALFPLPWPEERAAGKRLFSTGFLNLAASRLRPDGRFEMVTDSRALALWTMAEAERSALTLELAERGTAWDTKYERKWHGAGQELFYHLTGRKQFQPELRSLGETAMQAFYLEHFDPKTYRPRDLTGPTVVKFGDLVFDPGRETGLLRVLTVEGALKQDFFIRIVRHERGWKISPAIPGQLIPTTAVARALELASTAV